MAEPGAVAWQFERKGQIELPRDSDEDEVTLAALEAGAEDVTDNGDTWMIITGPSDLAVVRSGLEAAGYKILSAELGLVPSSTIEIDSENDARKILKLIDALEDNDDVQNVFANFDIPDEIIEALEG